MTFGYMIMTPKESKMTYKINQVEAFIEAASCDNEQKKGIIIRALFKHIEKENELGTYIEELELSFDEAVAFGIAYKNKFETKKNKLNHKIIKNIKLTINKLKQNIYYFWRKYKYFFRLKIKKIFKR